jgi:hypothetical protein
MKVEANQITFSIANLSNSSNRYSQRKTSEDSQIKNMLNSHPSWGLVLSPICESSEQISAERLPGDEQSGTSYSLSSGANCEARSLSETFASINKSALTNLQRKSCKTTAQTMKAVHRETGQNVPCSKEDPKNSLEMFTLAVAIDVLPCIIAVIWAAAIFFSMPSHAH